MTWCEEFTQSSHQNLLTAPDEVLEYLYGRGVSMEQIIRYRIGYNESMPSSAPKEAKRQTTLENFITFPLTTLAGTVMGFQFRRIDHKVYLDYIEDASQPISFGLSQAYRTMWDTGTVIITEGPFDMFPIERAIYPGVVATLSAKLSAPMRRLLSRIVTEIVVLYDLDKAGRAATRDIYFEYREAGDPTRIVTPRYMSLKGPDGATTKDPGSIWEALGDEGFRRYFEKYLPSHLAPYRSP